MNSPNLPCKPLEKSSNFELLDTRIQKWIWREGWTVLRDAQEEAIPVILQKVNDVLIAAETASGKTEAAFLPILTQLLSQKEMGVVLYISPLKALINDQWGRLSRLCEELEIPVTPWHGDVATGPKKKFLKVPRGIVLITPESLEAFLLSQGGNLRQVFKHLEYIVLDEAHAFIGEERGKQVQALLFRIEYALGRPVVRVGLSATFGDMALAAEFLRPGQAEKVSLIVSKDSTQGLKVLINGYINSIEEMALNSGKALNDKVPSEGEMRLISDLFNATRGAHNLIFPNSRRAVEQLTDKLNHLCEESGSPREYWPHHGSLSKSTREETETALKNHSKPAIGVATNTLELGLDIGDVESISHVGPPPSVASLRQRLGRSGRREGKHSILRCFCVESEIGADSTLNEEFREELLENIAMIELLIRRWFEPAPIEGLHFSTLIQQLLALIGQYGGMTTSKAWELLVESAVFKHISKAEFIVLLKHLGDKKIIVQESSGLLLHGEIGEKFTNHYSFFASFASTDEYRLICEHKTLGTLPVDKPLLPGAYFLFGGKRWLALSVDINKKIIMAVPAAGGKAPFFGEGGSFKRHSRIRETMRGILHSNLILPYLDDTANKLLSEARAKYWGFGLDKSRLISINEKLALFPWKGDTILDTIVLLLETQGIAASSHGLYILIRGASSADFHQALDRLLASPPDVLALAELVPNKTQEKWDYLLPPVLLNKNYASHSLDLSGALSFLSDLQSKG